MTMRKRSTGLLANMRLIRNQLYLAYPGLALFRVMWDPEPPYGFGALRPVERKSEYTVLANRVSLGVGYRLVNGLAGGVLSFRFLGEPVSRVRHRCRLDRFRKGGRWDIVLWYFYIKLNDFVKVCLS